MTALSGKVVKIQPSDEGTAAVECPYEYAALSITLKNMIDDLGEDLSSALPVHNVKSRELGKVLEWCKHRLETPDDKDKGIENIRDLDEWEKAYVGNMDQPATFQLILAANYLDIKPLLNLLCKSVALQLAGKTPEQIKAYFGITREFTPEEIEQVKRDRGLIPPENKEKQ